MDLRHERRSGPAAPSAAAPSSRTAGAFSERGLVALYLLQRLAELFVGLDVRDVREADHALYLPSSSHTTTRDMRCSRISRSASLMSSPSRHAITSRLVNALTFSSNERPSARTRIVRSRSVTVPIGFPRHRIGTNPMLSSFINFAQSRTESLAATLRRAHQLFHAHRVLPQATVSTRTTRRLASKRPQ